MKKIIAVLNCGLFSFGLMASSVHAAVVSIGYDGATYVNDGDSYTTPAPSSTTHEVYLKSWQTESDLVNPASQGGEEVIYLGAFEGAGNTAGSGTIDINVTTDGVAASAPISLVLSASTQTSWNFNINLSQTPINNIFVIASNPDALLPFQTINLGGESLALGAGTLTGSISGINIERYGFDACGFEFPNESFGCNTDIVLGLQTPKNIFDDNILLDEMITNVTGLQATHFAGTHTAHEFNVTLPSATAIPLPAASLLFLSGLGLLPFFRGQR